MLFRQLLDETSHTYTYLLGDQALGEALIIDPVLEQKDRDLKLLGELGLKLRIVVETHLHADHVTGADALKQQTGASTAVSRGAGNACADRLLTEGDEITLGAIRLTVRETPGHTAGCISLVGHGMVFTGDALLIRGCGRTDFQGGSAERLYRSVHEKLFTLPDDTLVYPAHDYKGVCCSSIREEKRCNPRLAGKSVQEFSAIMANLNLPPPAKIAVALPANEQCGRLPTQG